MNDSGASTSVRFGALSADPARPARSHRGRTSFTLVFRDLR
ncbi:hypothetical protein SCATT_37900 [Streptantibioticus cattleyicolor NRRL 8057 = DSM 46488]|uniref:Uncharacterized protein n=1 Tax=Streptantibioticus cattleyicolor (strain ATCC 35852 / DSM 46488 / JCM 4925 / NBRC 14057 / NRRL 8057) TaxID=1003195 RepID=G8WR04_STREN|nr:hypothetical protein SCATT_37900 [Streptantibioticus cattleyicolor NRRL 8057 = DSM 46488]